MNYAQSARPTARYVRLELTPTTLAGLIFAIKGPQISTAAQQAEAALDAADEFFKILEDRNKKTLG